MSQGPTQTSACHPSQRTDFSLLRLISRQVSQLLLSMSESSTVQTPPLVSPGPTPNLSLSRYSQCSSPGRLSESSLSKHLTCVSRTYSQPQPVEILLSIPKHVISGNQLTSHLQPMTSQSTCQKVKQKHTSSESRILKLFDALDFTSAMYQPSDHFRTLVQAQHRSRENLGAQYKRSQLHLRWRP